MTIIGKPIISIGKPRVFLKFNVENKNKTVNILYRVSFSIVNYVKIKLIWKGGGS